MSVPLNIDLKNKVAVVTGGGGILCSSMAAALAECGAKVAILDLRLENAQKAAEAIKKNGGEAIGIAANVLEKESLLAAHQAVKDAYGPCDILINGAGGNAPAATADDEEFSLDTLLRKDAKSFFDLETSGFRQVFDLNILGTLLPTQAFARDMAEREMGCILNISSMNAYRPLTKIPAYSAAKAGVSNFTQWLAVHFAKSGIRVNAIAPGFFSTAQNAALLWNPDGTPTARTGKILAATPMGRFGQPEELVGSLLYLLDENCSAFVTGVVLPIDGGFSAYSGV